MKGDYMIYQVLLTLFITTFCSFSSDNYSENLLSNNYIFLDRNIGATYILPDTEIEVG